MDECSKSQIVTLNAGRGQFYGEKRFSVQPLRNNGILVRGKGRIPRTSHSKSITYPEEGRVSRTSCQIDQLIRKKAGFSGQTRDRVSRTDADCGLTDKRGLRFTDRRSSDFPDTCHLNFPDTRHLNFPDASYLTKQPKSGITNSAQKTSLAEKWNNLQTSWQLVVKKTSTKVGTEHPHHIETEPVHGGFGHWKNGNHSAVSWQGQVSVDVSSHVEQSRHNSASDTSLSA